MQNVGLSQAQLADKAALGLGKEQTSFDGSNNVHFTFCIPRGYDGSQGFPGEVTNSKLNSVISGTSNNTNPIGTLGMTVGDPPTQSEMQSSPTS